VKLTGRKKRNNVTIVNVEKWAGGKREGVGVGLRSRRKELILSCQEKDGKKCVGSGKERGGKSSRPTIRFNQSFLLLKLAVSLTEKKSVTHSFSVKERNGGLRGEGT